MRLLSKAQENTSAFLMLYGGRGWEGERESGGGGRGRKEEGKRKINVNFSLRMISCYQIEFTFNIS